MPTFHTVEHDDFGSWVGLCRNKTTVGNNTEVTINNPYTTTNIQEPTLQNYIDLNTGLTPIHSCVRAGNDANRIIRDSHNALLNGDDRGAMDEMVLMGRLVQDGTGSTHFTYSVDETGTPCDGFAQFIQPTWSSSTTAGSTNQSLEEHDQYSWRTNLQFADLDPFTWVPVWGVGYGNATGQAGANPTVISKQHNYPDASMNYYDTAGSYDYVRPDGLSSSANNLYSCSWGNTGTGYMDRSHTWYLVYCHDGNGNGMLASCFGMSATGNKFYNHNTNAYSARNLAASNAHWNTHHGKFKYVPNTVLSDLFTTHNNDLQAIWDHYGANTYGGGRRIVYSSITGTTSRNDDTYSNGRVHMYGNISLIAYGPTANSTLSSPENIYVNHMKLRTSGSTADKDYVINRFGTYYRGSTDGIRNVWQYFVTGKVGDLIFYNHPTMWMTGYDDENFHYRAPGLSRFILHATHLGKCRINDFSVGAYTPVTRYMRRASSGILASYDVPYSNMEYIFPGSGVTYNPVSQLSSNSNFVDTGSSWTAPINMFDATAGTFSTVSNLGLTNALHIPLNGVASGNTAPNDLDPIEEFSILVRGIKQQNIGEYEIVFAITDSDRVTLVTATESQRVSVTDSAGGTIDTATKYPLSEASYSVVFKDSDSNIKYGDIKDGYLKMYVVEKTGTTV